MNTHFLDFIAIRNGLIGVAALIGVSACSSNEPEAPQPLNLSQAPKYSDDILAKEAMTAFDRGIYNVARETFTELREGYPSSYFAPLAELKIADCYFYEEDYPAALVAYEEFERLHPAHEAIPYVRLQFANSYYEQYGGPKRDQKPLIEAINVYRRLLQEFPASEYTALAKRRIDVAREALAEHELYVARFYKKQGFLSASANRYANLELDFAGTRAELDGEEDMKYADADLAELYNEREVSIQKITSSELTPSTPKLVLASAEADALARFRMASQTRSDYDFADGSSQTNQSDAPIIRSALSRFTCENLEGTIVVTARFRLPAQLINTSFAESKASARIRTEQQNDFSPLDEALSCEALEIKASVFTPNDAKTYELALEGARSDEFEFLKLDRPNRIVAILTPANSTL